jgi:hypothetical protein
MVFFRQAERLQGATDRMILAQFGLRASAVRQRRDVVAFTPLAQQFVNE